MRQELIKIRPITLATLAAVFLFIQAFEAPADVSQPNQKADTLSIDSQGNVEVNGKSQSEGAQERPADLHASVEKTIQGAEGSTVLYLRPVEARKVKEDGSVEKMQLSAEARPFVAEANWKMFDAEGNETNDPKLAQHVIMPYMADLSSAMFEVSWNECDDPVSGNYMGLPCNKTRGLSDEYVAYLKQNLIPCVSEAMTNLGLSPATKVHLMHDGTVADERHSHVSLHAAGRAIDIMEVTATSAKGQTNSFDFRVTSSKPQSIDRKFYEGFRACWNKLQVARNCPGRRDGPIGTIGWEDKKHIGHHLHTSMPFCPNNNGYFITER